MVQRSAWMARSACSRSNRRLSAAAVQGQTVTDAGSAAGAIEREVMRYDVVIVGAGPAGLACAIRLKQLKPAASACVLEKASAVRGHPPPGAGLEPAPPQRLVPPWGRGEPRLKG